MIKAIENPVGLNAIVEKMQQMIHDHLVKIYAIRNSEGVVTTPFQFDAYPLLYIKTDDKGRRTMEHFEGGVDYASKNWREQNKVWFIEPNPSKNVPGQIYEKQTVIDIYFTMNLSEAKPTITDHRADQEVRADIQSVIDRMYFVRNARTTTGIENVYKNFVHNPADDMQPWHCFKISVDVYSYRNDQNKCSI